MPLGLPAAEPALVLGRSHRGEDGRVAPDLAGAGDRERTSDRVSLVRQRGRAAGLRIRDLADLGLGEQRHVAGDLRERDDGHRQSSAQLRNPHPVGVPGQLGLRPARARTRTGARPRAPRRRAAPGSRPRRRAARPAAPSEPPRAAPGPPAPRRASPQPWSRRSSAPPAAAVCGRPSASSGARARARRTPRRRRRARGERGRDRAAPRASRRCRRRPGSSRPSARTARRHRRPPLSTRGRAARPGCRPHVLLRRSRRRRRGRRGRRRRSRRPPRPGSCRPAPRRPRARTRRRAAPAARPPRRSPHGARRERRGGRTPQTAKNVVCSSPWSRTSNSRPPSTGRATRPARSASGTSGEHAVLGVGGLVREVQPRPHGLQQPTREDEHGDVRCLQAAFAVVHAARLAEHEREPPLRVRSTAAPAEVGAVAAVLVRLPDLDHGVAHRLAFAVQQAARDPDRVRRAGRHQLGVVAAEQADREVGPDGLGRCRLGRHAQVSSGVSAGPPSTMSNV